MPPHADVLPQWQSPHGPQQSLMLALVMLQAIMLLVLAVVAGSDESRAGPRHGARHRAASCSRSGQASAHHPARHHGEPAAVGGRRLIGALLAVWGRPHCGRSPTPAGLELTFFTRITDGPRVCVGAGAAVRPPDRAATRATARAHGSGDVAARRRRRARPQHHARRVARTRSRAGHGRARGRRAVPQGLQRNAHDRSGVPQRRRAAG